MTNWEYTMVVAVYKPERAIKIDGPAESKKWEGSLMEALNYLGNLGWELASLAVDSTGEGPGVDIIILKRGKK